VKSRKPPRRSPLHASATPPLVPVEGLDLCRVTVRKRLVTRQSSGPVTVRIALAMMAGLAEHAFDEDERARLAALGTVLDPEPMTTFADERARRLLGSCDVLVGHWGCPVLDAAAIAQAPDLRLFAYAAGTVKQTVTDAVWDAGIVVTSAAAANAVPVAEYTLAVILLANKGALVAREKLRDPSLRAMRPRPLGNVGKRVGIIGASHVGRHVIELLQRFELEVVVSDPFLDAGAAASLGATLVPLEELLATSDVVSLHAPDIPETAGMIGAPQLALLRDGATFVNTARPRLVDGDALERELRTGRIAAVLDVTDPEPLPPDASLLAIPNAFVTPHLAGSQGTELRRLARTAIDEIERFVRGEPPRWPVTREQLASIA
jgi:phosphoglycerate dehydrogenase-like enzyme